MMTHSGELLEELQKAKKKLANKQINQEYEWNQMKIAVHVNIGKFKTNFPLIFL